MAENVGCMTSDRSFAECELLLNCNTTVVIYVAVGATHFTFFNFFLERQYKTFKDVWTLNQTDLSTILRYLGQMFAAATTFSIFGMRPKAGVEAEGDFSSSADVFILRVARSAKFLVAGCWALSAATLYFTIYHQIIVEYVEARGEEDDEVNGGNFFERSGYWLSLYIRDTFNRLVVKIGGERNNARVKSYWIGWAFALLVLISGICNCFEFIGRLLDRGDVIGMVMERQWLKITSILKPSSIFISTAILFSDLQRLRMKLWFKVCYMVPTLTCLLDVVNVLGSRKIRRLFLLSSMHLVC